MLIYCRGVAIIEHGETGELYEIYPEELEWETVGGSERSMGPETVYLATMDHPELGDILWSIVEYPVGAENTKETNVGKHNLIEDFDFGLEHEPDDAPEPENLVAWLSEYSEYAAKLTQSSIVSYLVDWFMYFYEDPANETPYNSREGGYQYIYGGPFDAEEELRLNFEGIVLDEIILKAVAEIESDGILDWAPSSRHPDKGGFVNEAMFERQSAIDYSFEDLQKISNSLDATGIGSKAERAKRMDVLEKISSLENNLPPPTTHGGIGHNQPPDDFALTDSEVLTIREDLEVVKSELLVDSPSVDIVAQKASKLSKFVSWVGSKVDKTVDEFCKAFGSTLGKALGVTLPASLLASPYWAKFGEFLVSLKEWLLISLGLG